jgi:hypothetical protein
MINKPLSILFFGDIVGRLGRETIKQLLPKLKKQYQPDLVIANGENLAHGKGLTPRTIQEMLEVGIDWLTTGDHCFDQTNLVKDCFSGQWPILRPANYQMDSPGQGYALIKHKEFKILLINLVGRSLMNRYFDCPFREAEKIISQFTDKKLSAIIIDIHAETTAEKIALRHFLDGKISALLGTHTHVPTADAQITNLGTGYITDVGMTGYQAGIIGVLPEPIIQSFLTQVKMGHQLPDKGLAQCNAVHLTIDPQTKYCLNIELLQKTINLSS